MALKRYINDGPVISFDSRCVRCRQGMDRDGRYCRRCLKSQRLKLFFGTIAMVQVAAAGFILLQAGTEAHAIPAFASRTAITPKNQNAGWLYYDVTDPLIDDVTHHARLIGDNAVAPQGSPATQGATRGTLEVSYSRHYGRTVMLSFPPVPKACGANPCEVHTIFDHQPASSIPFQDASDSNQTVLLLGDKEAFMASLTKAHDLTIIANLGTGRDNIMTFQVEGYALSLAALGLPFRVAADGETRHGG